MISLVNESHPYDITLGRRPANRDKGYPATSAFDGHAAIPATFGSLGSIGTFGCACGTTGSFGCVGTYGCSGTVGTGDKS
jgi:hypothetical protein